MNLNKTEIVICLGSSCFARGNKKIVNIIKQYLKENKLEDVVYFHGNHCTGNCNEGPVVLINNVTFRFVNEESIVEILDKQFNRN